MLIVADAIVAVFFPAFWTNFHFYPPSAKIIVNKTEIRNRNKKRKEETRIKGRNKNSKRE